MTLNRNEREKQKAYKQYVKQSMQHTCMYAHTHNLMTLHKAFTDTHGHVDANREQSMHLCRLYFTLLKNLICSFSAWSMLRTRRAKTHKHKDILRALMFIKQPAEMKPIRLCSHEKHSRRGDRHIHAESCINIKAPRQAPFPVSSFLPGQNKLQEDLRFSVHRVHIDISAGRNRF